MIDQSFEDDMEQLAAEIAMGAGAADVALHDKIDAFKALMPFYLFKKKSKAKHVEDDEDLPTFGNFQKRLSSVK